MRFKHPNALWILAFGRVWQTFSYFGTQTILALYFMHMFHLSRSDSYLLYGAYAAFAYGTPVLGGVIADKWLGSREALMTGNVLNIIGNLLLMSLHREVFCLGLAVSLVGSGLYKGTSAQLVGTLYQANTAQKEAGFTWFYLATNVGGALAPIAYGLAAYSMGWNFGFLLSAIGILIGTLWFLYNWQVWDNDQKRLVCKLTTKVFLYLSLLLACLLISVVFYLPKTINPALSALFTISLVYLVTIVAKHVGPGRRQLLALLIISFFGMFYFAAGMQIGTTITLFIQQQIQAGVIKTELPASAFSTLYSLFILILAPFLTYIWSWLKMQGISVSVLNKLVTGILLAMLAMIAFALAAITPFVMTGLILGNLMLSAGELALTPAVYTAISDGSPAGMKNTMMGCWLLFIALGGYLSSLLASAAHVVAEKTPLFHSEYVGEFMFMAGFTFVVAMVLIALSSKLSKMIAGG